MVLEVYVGHRAEGRQVSGERRQRLREFVEAERRGIGRSIEAPLQVLGDRHERESAAQAD